MSRKSVLFFFCVLMLPFAGDGQVFDTARELKKLVSDLKSMKNISYDYEMDIKFPNGERDYLKGMMYMNNDDWLYYNECDAFVMIYTHHWFYKADHRKKTLTIVNMDKDYNKKLRKATEKDIFQNGAVTTFLDSVLLKKATVQRIGKNGDTLEIALSFPKNVTVRKMDVVYDSKNHVPVKYDMTVNHPWQRTPKGIQVIETRMNCRNFKSITDKTVYDESNFFSYKKGKLELKKYNDYKFSTKM